MIKPTADLKVPLEWALFALNKIPNRELNRAPFFNTYQLCRYIENCLDVYRKEKEDVPS